MTEADTIRLQGAEIDQLCNMLLAKIAEVARLRAAAERVCWFDWSDNDSDAVAAIDELRRVARHNRKTAPYNASDYATVDSVIRHAAELDIENERLQAELAAVDAMVATHRWNIDPSPMESWPKDSILRAAVDRHDARVTKAAPGGDTGTAS